MANQDSYIQIRISQQLKTTLKKYAKDRRKSQSKVIREIVELVTLLDKPQSKEEHNEQSN